MGRYLVRLNELNDKNKYIEQTIDEIKSCIFNITNLKKDIIWEGPSRDKFLIKYDEYIEYLNNMVNNLESCVKVNKKFQDNFTEGYHEIKSNLKKVQRSVEEKWKR